MHEAEMFVNLIFLLLIFFMYSGIGLLFYLYLNPVNFFMSGL